MNLCRFVPALVAASLCASSANADRLTLTPLPSIDVQALALGACGDLAYDRLDNRLWIADGLAGGQIHQINPTTGAVVSTVDPSVVPGLDQGADGLAVGPTFTNSDLYVFSPFAEAEGGRVTQAGVLSVDFNTSQAATGADYDTSGNLWTVSGVSSGGGAQLRRINVATGASLETVQINPAITERMSDVAFDPHTGACYVLCELSNTLFEISLTTGNVVSSTDMAPFLVQTGQIVGGFEFDETGERVFVSTGSGAGADSIVVLKRDLAPTVCTGDGLSLACPCGNLGAPGRGCENSFATGGGLLESSGVPDISADDFVLSVQGLPPVTTALFFQGTTIPVEIFTFGDGIRCVSGTVIRLGVKNTVGGAAQYPTAGDQSIHVRGQIPAAGATRFYQAWYRNVATFCTPQGFNLTNARKVFWRT